MYGADARYGFAYYLVTNSSGTGTTGVVQFSYPSTNTSSSSTSYPRYWVTASDFKPYSNASSRYWASGNTFKWIAVWAPNKS